MTLRPLYLFALGLCLGVGLAGGCQVTDSLNSVLGEGIAFGDAYQIITDGTPQTALPRLDVADLHVWVRYSGGCRTHGFRVSTRRHDDTVELWLKHDANDDLCEALILEERVLPVPTDVLTAPRIVLLGPDGTTWPLR